MTGILSWSLDTDALTTSTAVFVDAPTGTTVRVRFSQAVNTFTNKVATQAFVLQVFDGVSPTTARVNTAAKKAAETARSLTHNGKGKYGDCRKPAS